MPAAKKKTKVSGSKPIDLPNNNFQSTKELSDAIGMIASLRRERDQISSEYNERLTEIGQELSEATEPFDRKIAHLANGIKYYTDQNKENLFEKDSKTVKFPTGQLSYRSQPTSVKTRSSQKLVDEILEKHELKDWWIKVLAKITKTFLRAKLELDKDACLKNKELAKEKLGIEFSEGEEKFYIKPAEMDEIEVQLDAAA